MEDTPMLLASAGRSEFTGVVRKGLWTAEEDLLLKKCIEKYGERHWHLVPSRAGLRRCRKSCRLRWLNYLKPNIKRGPFDEDEVEHIIKLQSLLGNRWTLIASRLPGRTANDIKNFWNSRLGKQVGPDYSQGVVQNEVAAASSDVELNPSGFTENSYPLIKQPSQCINPAGAIRGTRPGGSTHSFIVNPQAQIPPAKEEDLLSWVRNILLGDDDGEGEEEQQLQQQQQQQWEQENIVSLSAFLGPMNEACHETNYVEPPATYGEPAKEEDLLSWVRNILLGEEEEQLLLQQQQQWEQENIVSFPSSSQAGGVLELVAMSTPWSEEMQDRGQGDRVGGQY